MTIPFVNPILTAIQRRPMWLGVCLALAVCGWAGLIGYRFIVAPPPSEADIAGNIISLDEAALQRVTRQLEKYRVPIETPDLPRNPFVSP